MAGAERPRLRVEVAFALPDRQRLVTLEVPEGTSAREAVSRARLETLFPELPPSTFREADLGIFGRRLRDPDQEVLREGDRVEVYRPLTVDPKAIRAERAARGKR